MLTLQESDVFQTIQEGNSIGNKMSAVIDNRNGYRNVMNLLEAQYASIKRNYSADSIMPKIFNAITTGKLIVKYSKEPTNRLPTYMPFFKFALKDGIPRVIIDISQYATIHTKEDNTDEIGIDTPKLWCLLSSGYLCLEIASKSHIVPEMIASIGSRMWANLYVKPLNKTVGLYTDQTRYTAFKYFASKFFLTHILEYPNAAIDNILKNIYNKKSPLIQEIEETIDDRDIKIFDSFGSFCQTMFNNEITKVRFGSNASKMNVSYYLTSYVSMYGNGALLALASFPYFTHLVISSNNRSYLFNHKVLDDVCMNRQDYVKFLKSLYDDISRG